MTEKFTGIASHTYEDGREYTGEFVNGLPHGKGRMLFTNMDIYDGEWEKGVMNGKGVYDRHDAERDRYAEQYDGEFHKGGKQGGGRLQYADKSVYEGQWQNNMRTGVGTYWISEAEYFHGFWKFDEPIRGIFHLKNGDWYDGTFKNNKFDGYGRYYYANGDFFDGEFSEGKPIKGMIVHLDCTVSKIDGYEHGV